MIKIINQYKEVSLRQWLLKMRNNGVDTVKKIENQKRSDTKCSTDRGTHGNRIDCSLPHHMPMRSSDFRPVQAFVGEADRIESSD